MLKIENISKSYSSKKNALNGINLTIERGEIIGLIGLNGAGKSTLFKIVCDLIKPNEGKVYIKNYKNDSIKAKSLISYTPETPLLYEYLTLKQQIDFILSAYSIDKKSVDINYYLELFQMNENYNKQIKDFSKGMKQKSSLILSFIVNNPLLLLDEPFNSLDPTGIKRVKDEIKKMKRENKTILVSSHYLDVVKDFVDKFIIIDKGSIVKTVDNSKDSQLDIETIFNEIVS
ncbi:MAG: ABC transporter ATP-binding protein [Candidatus Cloacimonadota bacterium]|nr:MAG: ABC transporter ATP-binding protein [Candidatus Cloacimonadota bacterium]PIE79203.1 MAG: ABC transporter ATP-binding protein [Candidatus Delongbacteria bacterium]